MKNILRNILGDRLHSQFGYWKNVRGNFPYQIALEAQLRGLQPSSQLMQDAVALSFLGWKKKGYFVEIGVGDGINISNTYMLERQMGWTGLLCEPNPYFSDQIRTNRPATRFDSRAAYDESGLTLDFAHVARYPELSTLQAFAASDHHREKRAASETTPVQTVSIADLFAEHDTPSHIDFMSVDTEGSEVKILSTLPFDRYSFGFVAVEHNNRAADKAEIIDIMDRNGYRPVMERSSFVDSWFVPKGQS